MTTSTRRHVVAVVGGATAGAEAAAMLADRGVVVVVFEQNQRPYGKIEDGLPRWHVKLRRTSSIGSVPEPMAGVEQDGHLYRWADPDLGRLGGYESVFSMGNVVTGKGNIVASRRHSVRVTSHVIESYLGLGNGRHEGEEALLAPTTRAADAAAMRLMATLRRKRAPTPAAVDALLTRVHARREAVGFTSSYREWLKRVTPPDLA
jgi:hypothetical protein